MRKFILIPLLFVISLPCFADQDSSENAPRERSGVTCKYIINDIAFTYLSSIEENDENADFKIIVRRPDFDKFKARFNYKQKNYILTMIANSLPVSITDDPDCEIRGLSLTIEDTATGETSHSDLPIPDEWKDLVLKK